VRVGKLLDAAPPACELSVVDEEGAQGRHWDMQVGVSAVGQVLAACAADGRALDQVFYCSHEAAAVSEASAETLPCSAVLDASGYTWTPALASLPPRDASTAEAAGRGDGGDEGEGLEVQEVEEWPEERAAAHTTAVLTVPALVGAVAYAGAVWRGLAVFPPPARSFYSFAELLPPTGIALYVANNIRASIMDKRPSRPLIAWSTPPDADDD